MIQFADALRVLVIVISLAVVALSAVTLEGYTSHLNRQDAQHRLSRHVVKIAGSHMLAIGTLVAFTTSRWGNPPTLVLPFALLTSVATLSALIDLLVFQSRRRRAAEAHTRRSTDLGGDP